VQLQNKNLMKWSFALPMTVVAFSGIVACGAPAQRESQDDSASSALINAPEDSGHLFSVGVCGGSPNQDPNAGALGVCLVAGRRCTGTLVAPNLILTARHCVDTEQFTDGIPYCDNTFANTPVPDSHVTLSDSTLVGTPDWLDVAETRLPNTNRLCDDDMALLVLKNNVPGSVVKPISVDLGRDLAKSPPEAITIVGRGVIAQHLDLETGETTYDQAGLKRRILKNIPFVCASDVDETCVVEDYSSPPSNIFKLPKSLALFGIGSASGDSGAGYLEQSSFNAGHPTVIAVDTLGTYAGDGSVNSSIGLRTSLKKDFLRQGAQHAAELGGYPVPVWARDHATQD